MQLSQQRLKILRLLYEERKQATLSTLSIDELAVHLGISMDDTWVDLNYLEESGYISIRSRQLGILLRYRLAITARGVDVVEAIALDQGDLHPPADDAHPEAREAPEHDESSGAIARPGSRLVEQEYASGKSPLDIFVSHSHLDSGFCRRLVAALWRHFPEAVIFFDELELHGGDEYMQRIPKELLRSIIFIVVLSENAVASRWVQEETRLALNESLSDGKPYVIPVRYRECDSDQISPLLRNRHIIDCAYQDESIGFAQLATALQSRLS